MKNFYRKNTWNSGLTQAHVDPPPIPLIKGNHDDKLEKYLVKLKFCMYLTSATSDLYEFKMDFFGNGEPEYFLLFVQNFNINLAASGKLVTGAKIQCLCTLVRG